MVNVPFVPFDPTEVGPSDVVGAVFAWLVRRWIPIAIAGAFIATLAVWQGWSFPSSRAFLESPPNWAMVAILTSLLVAPMYLVSKRVADGVYTREVKRVVEVDGISPGYNVYLLEPETFEKMTVHNHNGTEKDRDFLNEVHVNGKPAVEVDEYDPEENVATASWLAGATNAEIRVQREKIDDIKGDLEAEADKALEFLARAPTIMRSQSTDVANYLIREVQGIDQPQGEQLHDQLAEAYEDIDVEDLLGVGKEAENGEDDEGEIEELLEEAKP